MISVLMSTYREPLGLVQPAVESMLGQEGIDGLELVLVVDDPTNDEVRDWACGQLASQPGAKVVVNEENRGLARSLNEAIAQASGDYLCRMDADDLSRPHRLRTQLAALEERGLDLVGARMEVMSDDGRPLYATPQLPAGPEAVRRACRWNNSMPHPTWFGRREVFQQLYRPMPLCEDYDFQIRALLAGWKLGNVEEPLVRYRLSEGSLSRSRLYEQYLYQRYLSARFRQGQAADPEAARAYVEGHQDEGRAARYAAANRRFNDALALLSGHPLQALAQLAPIPFMSPGYLDKIRRLALAQAQARVRS